jgi:hypothetical protein
MTSRRRRGDRGSSVTEFVLLLPVYAALLFGVILLGDATLVKQEIHQVSALYAVKTGVQTTDDVRGGHFGMFGDDGTVTFFSDDVDPGDVYADADIEDALVRLGTGEFFVHYEITPDGLKPVTTGGEKTWQGKYVEQNNLDDPENLRLIADVLNGWLSRNASRVDYNYKPFFMEALFRDLSDALRERGRSSDSVDRWMDAGVTLSGTSVTAGRGERKRTLAGAGGYKHAIEDELLKLTDPGDVPMPDYPNFNTSASGFLEAN